MREILFRGKRPDNGEWVYGDLLRNPIDDGIVIVDFGTINYFHEIVDPTTVGQYTGLTDKNGNKIFEGDIIEVTSCDYHSLGKKITCEIVYDRGCFWAKRTDAPEIKSSLSSAELQHTVAIIGNIHDNPENINNSEFPSL